MSDGVLTPESDILAGDADAGLVLSPQKIHRDAYNPRFTNPTEIIMNKLLKLCGLLGLLLVNAAFAADGIRVEGAWSRATAPGQDTAMVDFSIASDKAASLTGASSPACGSIEIHSMTYDNGMMKMRQVQSVELPAGERVDLGKRGYHLMLLGLKKPLALGDTVPLTLTIQQGGKSQLKVEVRAEIRPLTETAPGNDQGMHHHHMHH